MEVLEGEGKDDHTLREIQKILYTTEVRHPPIFLANHTSEIFFCLKGRVRGS